MGELKTMKGFLTLILWLSIDFFCTAQGGGDGLIFSELGASGSFNHGLGNGNAAHGLWTPSSPSLETEREDVFLLLHSDTKGGEIKLGRRCL